MWVLRTHLHLVFPKVWLSHRLHSRYSFSDNPKQFLPSKLVSIQQHTANSKLFDSRKVPKWRLWPCCDPKREHPTVRLIQKCAWVCSLRWTTTKQLPNLLNLCNLFQRVKLCTLRSIGPLTVCWVYRRPLFVRKYLLSVQSKQRVHLIERVCQVFDLRLWSLSQRLPGSTWYVWAKDLCSLLARHIQLTVWTGTGSVCLVCSFRPKLMQILWGWVPREYRQSAQLWIEMCLKPIPYHYLCKRSRIFKQSCHRVLNLSKSMRLL